MKVPRLSWKLDLKSGTIHLGHMLTRISYASLTRSDDQEPVAPQQPSS
uniref:Uncharacterized protein n=1 Tax=Lepeophtheirus salmonis TaxID=72036 RepID=A0A0K2T2C4_LEPSM